MISKQLPVVGSSFDYHYNGESKMAATQKHFYIAT